MRKKIIFALALLTLLGMGTWGAVSVATADDNPRPLPAVVRPALSDAAERTAERAEHRAATIELWRAGQERARIGAEKEAQRQREAVERGAEAQRQREAEQYTPPQLDGTWCYPGGPGCPGIPDTSGIAPAPDNGGQPPGSYCYVSPEGRVCTTY